MKDSESGWICWGRKAVRTLQKIVPESSDGVHFLAYHLVDGKTGLPVDISKETFSKQIEDIQRFAQFCSMDHAVEILKSGTQSGRYVVITFDDAYKNFYECAWPILEQWKVPALLYVPVDFVNGRGTSPISACASMPACTWSDLSDMLRTGLLTIGSHTVTHADLRRIDSGNAQIEIRDSRRRIEDRLGVAVTSFCYPMGLWSRRLEQIVGTTYQTAVIGGGLQQKFLKFNPLRLSRLPIRTDMPRDIHELLERKFWLEEQIAYRVRPWIRDRNRYRYFH